MKRLVVTIIVIFLATYSIGFADDLVPPPWERQSYGTTYQNWDFLTSDDTPEPDAAYNPYGDTALRIRTDYDWSDGVWPLSGEIDVYIPNRPDPLEVKEIWLQLTWKEEDLCPDPFLPPQPVIGVTSSPMFESMNMTIIEEIDLQDDWKHTTFAIDLYPNPEAEWISIKGDISVDQLVIDTRCIPEPATIVLLGVGTLITAFRKRKAA